MKLLLALSLIGSSLSAQAFLGPHAIQKSLEAKALQMPREKSSGTCARLAGTWKGTCQKEGETKESVIKIQQSGCEQLTLIMTADDGSIDRTEIDLTGGSETKSRSSFGMSMNMSVAAAWSTDKQVVQVSAVILANSTFLNRPMKADATAQIMKDGDDLVTFFESKGDVSEPGKESCRYKKN
jgi:hypothetical protein